MGSNKKQHPSPPSKDPSRPHLIHLGSDRRSHQSNGDTIGNSGTVSSIENLVVIPEGDESLGPFSGGTGEKLVRIIVVAQNPVSDKPGSDRCVGRVAHVVGDGGGNWGIFGRESVQVFHSAGAGVDKVVAGLGRHCIDVLVA
jgi:hypothetical protein